MTKTIIAYLICTFHFVCRSSSWGKTCLALLSLALLPTQLLASSPSPLPYTAFSQLPQAYNVRLSPDGTDVAFFKNFKDETLLVTKNLKTGEIKGIVKSDNKTFKLRWFRWGNNDKLVFSMVYPNSRGGTSIYSRGGIAKTTETRLMVADKSGGMFQPLIKARIKDVTGPLEKNDHRAQYQDNVISWLPDDPDHILVSVDFDTPLMDSVYKVNLNKRSRKRVQRPIGNIRSWGADQQGNIRFGNGFDYRKGIQFTRILDIETDKWHTLWEGEAVFDPPYRPIGFGKDPHILYLRGDHNGLDAIFTIDTRKLNQEPVLKLSNPDYDIDGGLIYAHKSREAIGAYCADGEGGREYWNNPYEPLQKGLNKALPDTVNSLVSFSDNEQRYILYTSSDTTPGLFFMGDREAKTLEPLLAVNPYLPDEILAQKKRYDLTMRDGLEIEAYLTLPVQGPNKNIPAVIFPHGGPMSRDYGNFDYWTQFFANRGIAVLQPNYRGSSGYGHEFMLQGIGQYGLGMQDDLVDSTQWLIDEGIADPDRICIVGASYGGYAAMTAAYKSPELFQCAVSFAGISDLKSKRFRSRNYTNKQIVRKQLGSDSDSLASNSPFYNVEQIDIPLLLMHGERDRVVDVDQSRKIAEKLEENGKAFSYIELDDGSHYLLNQRNRHRLFKEMDEFLGKHLKLEKGKVSSLD